MQFNFAKSFLVLISLMFSSSLLAQIKVSGIVTDASTNKLLNAVEIYDSSKGLLATTNAKGYYEFTTEKGNVPLVFFAHNYEVKEEMLTITNDMTYNVSLAQLSETLTEVVISAQRQKIVALKSLKDVEGTAIYAGKKTELVTVDQSLASLATNNARQIYGEVAGLNIYENDDAGLQLNIGGRGLDPNRTANFNTRQNGYDISADVLGYPESYYTPAAEGLKQVQVIRGAASLQYGTQFGGLINFIMKGPNPNKPFELITRNTLGSNGLYTNFTSVGGTKDQFSYYGFFNYKKGDGFRPNSEFESKNAYVHLGYAITDRTKITGELTYLRYLAQQAGGLTDQMFNENPFQSNRSRNWFEVDWLLYNLKLEHEFSKKTNFTLSVFGLDAARRAVGFRGDPRLLNTNPITYPDYTNPDGSYTNTRDLLIGDFTNWGAEARLLTRYSIKDRKSVLLLGAKYYRAKNKAVQGAGENSIAPNFDLATSQFPNYPNQSSFEFPNLNLAFFGENIFYVTEQFSLTPGIRVEYIKTASDGAYRNVVFDNAGNPISNTLEFDNRTFERSLVLLGLGASYKPTNSFEGYANFSQNYRSVTFNDIRTVSPSFIIDPNITDEKGFTADLGVRGKYKGHFIYDIGGFLMYYNNRIGDIFDNRANRVRGNIGAALIGGLEAYTNWNIWHSVINDNQDFKLNTFVNLAYTTSEYVKSSKSNVKGNKVEFIPAVNFKGGVKFGYKNFLGSVQYSYISEQFTEATNAPIPVAGDARSGLTGEVPAYSILDCSLSYTYKRFRLETGLNNILDRKYFTRRATGYPGPGIIPSAPRNWYTTLQIKF